MTLGPPRFAPSLELPRYAYIPGKGPHPRHDREIHGFALAHDSPCSAITADAWRESPEYLYGIDLFNHGYYWEAHEAWEMLWHAVGRTGALGLFLKALIKLAAAGVKVHEGRPAGTQILARQALETFQKTRAALPVDTLKYFGLSLSELEKFAEQAAQCIAFVDERRDEMIVFAFRLLPC